MPAFGIVLFILGLWVLLRTIRHTTLSNGKQGGLVEAITG